MSEQEKKLLLVLLDELQRSSGDRAKRMRAATNEQNTLSSEDAYEVGFADGQASAYTYIARIIRGDVN